MGPRSRLVTVLMLSHSHSRALGVGTIKATHAGPRPRCVTPPTSDASGPHFLPNSPDGVLRRLRGHKYEQACVTGAGQGPTGPTVSFLLWQNPPRGVSETLALEGGMPFLCCCFRSVVGLCQRLSQRAADYIGGASGRRHSLAALSKLATLKTLATLATPEMRTMLATCKMQSLLATLEALEVLPMLVMLPTLAMLVTLAIPAMLAALEVLVPKQRTCALAAALPAVPAGNIAAAGMSSVRLEPYRSKAGTVLILGPVPIKSGNVLQPGSQNCAVCCVMAAVSSSSDKAGGQFGRPVSSATFVSRCRAVRAVCAGLAANKARVHTQYMQSLTTTPRGGCLSRNDRSGDVMVTSPAHYWTVNFSGPCAFLSFPHPAVVEVVYERADPV
eukprot:365433-Chlamydomonas_euryale.AAC.9